MNAPINPWVQSGLSKSFETVTLIAYNLRSGKKYTLDTDVKWGPIDRIYFPKGKWIGLFKCELIKDLQAKYEDKQGRT